MRLALKQGYGHADRLLAVLTHRQQIEVELFAGIEPIPDVSEPKDVADDGPQTEQEAESMFHTITGILGAEPVKKKRKKRRKR